MSANMLITDDECDRCYGTKTDRDDKSPCLRCAGIGRELTPLGEELVNVLRDFYDITPKAEK